MEMDVETTQIAAACLGIGTVIQKKKKNVDSEKSGLSRGFRRGKLLLKATTFFASFGAFSFFWRLFLRSCYKQRPPC